jgi:hypothetical protein
MANLKSLNEIFTNTLYRIPDYQRGYAWTLKQLNYFWDDLYNLNETKHHYTGVLTVKGVPVEVSNSLNWNDEQWVLKERGYKAYFVVDGQQRLTTSIIFIQALIEVIQSLPKNNAIAESEVYVGTFSIKEIKEIFLSVIRPPHNMIRTYKFGYESDNPSFKFLRHRIFNEEYGGSINETFYTLNLENSKRFFLEKIKSVLDKAGEDTVVELFRKLTVNFKFNLYEIEDDFDVFVAFETMNNRGKDLSKLEILKNRLIYLTTLYDENDLKEDDRISLRTKIDEAWKEVYYQLGRNKKSPLYDDDFLYAHWIMYFQYKRQKGDDYINFLLNKQFTPKNIFEKVEIPVTSLEEFEEIKESDEIFEEDDNEDKDEKAKVPLFDGVFARALRSKLKPKDIEDYVNSLKSAAVHWYNTFNPLTSSDLIISEKEWIDRLNRIGIAYFRPLITASFLNTEINSNQRIKLFEAVERFIFIAFRLKNANANYGDSEFYKAARLLREGKATVNDIVDLLNERLDFVFVNTTAPVVALRSEYERLGDEHGYASSEANEVYNKFAKAFDETCWIDDVRFKKYIDKNFQNGSGFYGWKSLRYFLYEYEMELVKLRGSQKIDWNLFVKNDGDKVSIEHILPQTPDKPCWKSILKDISKKDTIKLQGTIGNLLPLSKSINSSLQNDCFEEKKKAKVDDKGNKIRLGYDDGSHSEIEVSKKLEWTSKEILDRGISLLSFMEKRWGFRFESEENKIELLGLSFLKQEVSV